MTKTQTYLYRLMVQGSLVWAASMAAMSGQTNGSNASQAFTAASVNPIGVKGEFTGDVGCRNCHKHDKIWDSFYKNPHFKSVASGKEPPERTGCEGCHGPGKAHVDAGGDINTVVHAFSVMKLALGFERTRNGIIGSRS